MCAAKPIPEGCHTLTAHLVVKNASQAIDFYKKAFGAEEIFRMPGPDGESVIHAELKIGDSKVYLVDEMPGMNGPVSPESLGGTCVMIHLWSTNADAAYDRAVKAGAKVTMPLMDAFWGDRYGQGPTPLAIAGASRRTGKT